jgi:hypothetical protein
LVQGGNEEPGHLKQSGVPRGINDATGRRLRTVAESAPTGCRG